jgi:hypothetical protein
VVWGPIWWFRQLLRARGLSKIAQKRPKTTFFKNGLRASRGVYRVVLGGLTQFWDGLGPFWMVLGPIWWFRQLLGAADKGWGTTRGLSKIARKCPKTTFFKNGLRASRGIYRVVWGGLNQFSDGLGPFWVVSGPIWWFRQILRAPDKGQGT